MLSIFSNHRLTSFQTSVSAHGGKAHPECTCSCSATNGTQAEVGDTDVEACDECTAEFCSTTFPNQCVGTFTFNCTSDAIHVIGASFAVALVALVNLF